MVRRGTLACGLLLCLSALSASAQDFSPADTLTEYPHKGTYYHDRFVGRKTASGEVFDQNRFTAAHWKIKLGTLVMVTNRNTGLQVIVKVNDRCPKHGVFDMSHRAATAIGIRGSQPVTVRLLPEGYAARWTAQEPLFDSVAVGPAARPALATAPRPDAPQASALVPAKPEPPAEEPRAEADLHGTATRCCNLALGIATSHAEAYDMIQRLPELYREKVAVEPLSDDELQLTLEVNLPHAKAKSLSRALRHSFPGISVACCE